jgi:hypothetical protein
VPKEAREDLVAEALVGVDDERLARRVPHDAVSVALGVSEEVVQLGDERLDARSEADGSLDDALHGGEASERSTEGNVLGATHICLESTAGAPASGERAGWERSCIVCDRGKRAEDLSDGEGRGRGELLCDDGRGRGAGREKRVVRGVGRRGGREREGEGGASERGHLGCGPSAALDGAEEGGAVVWRECERGRERRSVCWAHCERMRGALARSEVVERERQAAGAAAVVGGRRARPCERCDGTCEGSVERGRVFVDRGHDRMRVFGEQAGEKWGTRGCGSTPSWAGWAGWGMLGRVEQRFHGSRRTRARQSK